MPMPEDLQANGIKFPDDRGVLVGYSATADEYYLAFSDEQGKIRKFAIHSDSAHLLADLINSVRPISDMLYMTGHVAESTDAEKWA